MPVSNTLDFIQRYVATNTDNHNLQKMKFKVKCEASILTIKKLIFAKNALFVNCSNF